MRIRPTRLGAKALVFYAMVVFSFFVAPYLNLFFLLLAFASVVAVLSGIWCWRNLAGVQGTMLECPPLVAHAAQPGRVKLYPGRRPRHALSIKIELAGKAHHIAQNLELAGGDPSEAREVEVMMPSLSRGAYYIQSLRLSSPYPFGLFFADQNLLAPERVFVYPAPADLAAYRDRNGTAGLGNLSGEHDQDLGIAGLREYRHGDELRAVHWKASARRNELVIREFEGDSTPGVEVLLDLCSNPEDFEEAVSLCTALALECEANKELFTLKSQDHSATYGKGHTPMDEVLRYLAQVRVLPLGSAAAPAVSPGVLRLPLPRRATRRAVTPREEVTT